ncbi:MAG TPA: transcriptional regulator [Clostridiales bacterium]|nr:transcriptional regulator [Clostridiales bacterium]
MFKCNLRILMAEKKIDNITDLMELSGLSRNAINRLYREVELEKVSMETLVKLCDTFYCRLSELFEYIPD